MTIGIAIGSIGSGDGSGDAIPASAKGPKETTPSCLDRVLAEERIRRMDVSSLRMGFDVFIEKAGMLIGRHHHKGKPGGKGPRGTI
jgi:hypothetical protein